MKKIKGSILTMIPLLFLVAYSIFIHAETIYNYTIVNKYHVERKSRASIQTSLIESLLRMLIFPICKPSYKYAYAKYKLDGIHNSYIVYVRGLDNCGSGGCTMYVFTWSKSGLAHSVIDPMFLPIYLLKSRHHGMYDLGVYARGRHMKMHYIIWDGNRYKYSNKTALSITHKINNKHVLIRKNEKLYGLYKTNNRQGCPENSRWPPKSE